MEPRSPTLQADALPAEPQGKPKNTTVDNLSLLQRIFPTQESLQDSLPTELSGKPKYNVNAMQKIAKYSANSSLAL